MILNYETTAITEWIDNDPRRITDVKEMWCQALSNSVTGEELRTFASYLRYYCEDRAAYEYNPRSKFPVKNIMSRSMDQVNWQALAKIYSEKEG